jgi:MoxR-like ATPase
MEFYCYELNRTISARHRPVVIITSNNEKELPDPFLRRCFFYYIPFPDKPTMESIIRVHYPDLEQRLLDEAMRLFYGVRGVQGLKKRPSTSELIDWIRLLSINQFSPEELSQLEPGQKPVPYEGALLKNEQDLTLFERLRRRFLGQ